MVGSKRVIFGSYYSRFQLEKAFWKYSSTSYNPKQNWPLPLNFSPWHKQCVTWLLFVFIKTGRRAGVKILPPEDWRAGDAVEGTGNTGMLQVSFRVTWCFFLPNLPFLISVTTAVFDKDVLGCMIFDFFIFWFCPTLYPVTHVDTGICTYFFHLIHLSHSRHFDIK